MTGPSLAATIAAVAEDTTPDAVAVSVAGRVLSYDGETQTATVQPVVNALYVQPDGSTEVVVPPALDGVPVKHPGAGGMSLHLPVAVGDYVLLIVRDRSHDEVDANGIPASGTTTPASARRYSLADCVAVPVKGGTTDGLELAKVHATDPVFGLEAGMALRIGAAKADYTLAVASLVAAKVAALEAAINSLTLPVVGTATAGVVTGTAGPPLPSPFPTPTVTADVQTTRARVDQ